MICKECKHFDDIGFCKHHETRTESNWRCACGVPKEALTDEDTKKLEHDIQSKVHGQHPFGDDPVHGDRESLLDSTFGMAAMECLDDMLEHYKIDKNCNLEDPVNHPSHYTDGSIEVIDYIEDKKLPYHLGNAVKYISRAGKKDDAIQDLKKAAWYINRYIELLSK